MARAGRIASSIPRPRALGRCGADPEAGSLGNHRGARRHPSAWSRSLPLLDLALAGLRLGLDGVAVARPRRVHLAGIRVHLHADPELLGARGAVVDVEVALDRLA